MYLSVNCESALVILLCMLLDISAGMVPVRKNSRNLKISKENLLLERYPLHTYSDAVRYCREIYGTTLPVITDYASNAKYAIKAGDNNINSFWLPFRVTYFDHYRYLRLDTFETVPLNSTRSNKACVSINFDYSQHRLIDCKSTHLGYICLDNSVKGKDCIESAVSSRKVKVNGACYSVHLDKRNWFDARWMCSKYGESLSSIHLNEVKDLTGRLRELFPDDEHMIRDFWIGLRQMDFILDIPGTPLNGTYMRIAYWDFGQPQIDGECVKMFQNSNKVYYWATVSCQKKHKTVCSEGMSANTAAITAAATTSAAVTMSHETTALSSSVPSPSCNPSQICKSGENAIAALGVLFGLVIIGYVPCVIYIMKLKKECMSRSTRSTSELKPPGQEVCNNLITD